MAQVRSLERLIEQLGATRRGGDPKTLDKRRRLLEACAECKLTGIRRIRGYHALLRYLQAYPDDPPMLELVERELRRVADATASPSMAERLADSGLPGTRVQANFSISMIRWLLRRFPRDVEITWEEAESIEEILPACVARVERDGVAGEGLSVQEWLGVAAGPRQHELEWLVDRLATLPAADELRDRVFEALELPITWTVSRAVTELRFPGRRTVYGPPAPPRGALPEPWLRRPLPKPVGLTSREAVELIDLARVTLCLRQRETDPFTHADPRDVTLFRLEDGIDVALFGMRPGRRLPIEGFVGYLAARNRHPVAYGGAWIFGERAEIGINVFEAYRGGNSALLFSQILRVYHQRFGVRRFVVDPFQFGADNREGVRSGAFWFYHRLGFRPTEPALAELAETETARLQKDRAYRTPAAILRRLARGRLACETDPSPAGASVLPELAEVALAVTRVIGERFRGDRDRALAWSRRRCARVLSVRDRSRWSDPESSAFDDLSLIVALLPGLEHWPGRDRRALAGLMRAKGGPREQDYLLRVRALPRLTEALAALCAATAQSDPRR
ncbi:MAG: hypothetical protein ACYS0D_01460 [Planctomycetota bacterium]|jgi:hypothetical protein